MKRRFEGLECLVIYLDKIPLADRETVIALGVDPHGIQRVLGFCLVDANSTLAVARMFDELLARGLVLEEKGLFIIRDSKPLRDAVSLVYGRSQEVQRCRKDREERVLAVLPKAMSGDTRSAIRAAWATADGDGLPRLETLAREIEQEYPEAAERLLESLDECFTVDRLGVRPPLSHFLMRKPGLQSLGASLARLGSQWSLQKDVRQIKTSIAAVLADEEQRFRRLSGYRALPELRNALTTLEEPGPSVTTEGTGLLAQQFLGGLPRLFPTSASAEIPLTSGQNASALGNQGLTQRFPLRSPVVHGKIVKPLLDNVQSIARLMSRVLPDRRSFQLLGHLRSAWAAHASAKEPSGPSLWESRMARQEEFRLVQRLFLLPLPDGPKTVVFSGVERGNGCSRVSARAGVTLAKYVSGSVCVVDANLQAPSLHRYFGVENNRGLLEALISSDPVRDCARNLSLGNLWVMPTGSMPTDSNVSGITLVQLEKVLEELKATFDYILGSSGILVARERGSARRSGSRWR